MRRTALVVLLLPLTAAGQWCAPPRPSVLYVVGNAYCEATEHNLSFLAKPKYPTMKVEWKAVDDVPAECGNPLSKGCAFIENNKCLVITGRDTNLAILGHEIRHCFEGQWHN